ncbi:MAG: hypothetical protein JXB25_03850 [Deltaproteobacteria bacterium]|nr:hypothetical protein [Deltaproteobacteria bacterium]
MREKITIEIEKFTGIEELTPEVVYLPFESAYEHPYRKFHEHAWSAAVDGEIVLVDENLERLWEGLKEMVLELLAGEEGVENGNGVPEQYGADSLETDSGPESDQDRSGAEEDEE